MLTRLMHAACSSWPLDAVSLWQAGFPPADARPTARRHLPGQQLHLGGRLAGRPEGGTRDREAETARLQKTGRVESGTAEPGERGLGLPGWGGETAGPQKTGRVESGTGGAGRSGLGLPGWGAMP
jgi:hypothetical protein